MPIPFDRLLHSILWAGLVLLCATNASARTYLDDCANNGVLLTSEVSLGFLDVPGGGFTATTGSFPYGSPPPPGVDHATTVVGPVLVVNPTVSGSTATSPSPLVKTPASGAPKDQVETAAELYFEFGTPSGSTPDDTFSFRAQGVASAVNAFLISGNPADAQTGVLHRVEFFNDLVPASGPATTCSGNLRLPEMPALASFETTRKLEVIQNPATSPVLLLSQSAGDPATSFTLVPGTQYEIRYAYEYIVPHGIDPPFDGGYDITVTPPPTVPTGGGAGALLLISALGITGSLTIRVLRRSIAGAAG